MIYQNNHKVETNVVDVFGGGNLFQTVKPYLEKENIRIGNIYDDLGTFGLPWPSARLLRKSERPILFCIGYDNNSQQPMRGRFIRYQELKKDGVCFSSFVSNDTFIGPDCVIENGSIIMPGVFLHCRVHIGEAVYVNIRSTISHDNQIADNVFFGPGVTMAGSVKTGPGVFIGVGATIINSCVIGNNSIIGGGAMVTSSVPDKVMVAGVPAVIKKNLE